MNPNAPATSLLNSLFSLESGWVVLKWVYVMLFAIYLIFTLVVFAQKRQMVATLKSSFDGVIVALGIVHLMLAVGALVLAIVIL